MGVEGGYCCVYLPDGSASLAPTHNGQTIKDMLASLCEKRGFPLKDVIIYLQGKDKVRAHLFCLWHQTAEWAGLNKCSDFFPLPFEYTKQVITILPVGFDFYCDFINTSNQNQILYSI